MVLEKIAILLSQTIGLDPEVISSNRMARAVEARRIDCKLSDLDSYWTRLQTSAAELEELIELSIVPETWFFRDGKPFDCLKTYVTSEWLPKPNRHKLQLLSVPSSTGEEPYSMAISLLEAGLQPQQFAIEAIDISHRSLAKARLGIYTKNSFRGDAWRERDRERYFQQTDNGYELCQSVRDLVDFQHGNVMTSLGMMQKKYDIIFCRHLLIYLRSAACDRVLAALDRLLLPGGLLFVGGSETGKIVAPHYVSLRQPFTFAYRKSAPNLDRPSKFSSQIVTPIQPSVTVKNADPPDRQQIESTNSPANLNPQSLPDLDLQTVRNLADLGRVAEAIELCHTYLKDRPTSAAAYILLGEMYQANQQSVRAEQSFQRAIYLEPSSYPALVYLAILKEDRGDLVGANIIRQRIGRLPPGVQNISGGGES
jgi:chemotaxis protein methyltransferase WspC